MTVMCFMTVGCSGNLDDGFGNEEIDISRTQLYVSNHSGGYGSDWLYAAKERFEELYKDYPGENGKKGVQIYVDVEDNKSLTSAQILAGRSEIYFTEYASYFDMVAEGALDDITEVYTKSLDEFGDPDGKTLLDKLTAEQKEYFLMPDGKYYAVPHYSGYYGFTYDADLFDTYGYYFKDGAVTEGVDPTDENELDKIFIKPNSNDKKSAGPDGEYNTYDDGLPTTYEEFFLLCEHIIDAHQIPVTWSGNNYTQYTRGLASSLAVEAVGADEFKLNFTFDGTATTLGKVEGGEFVYDTTPTKITEANGYELYRSAGNYYALSFIEKLVTKNNGTNVYLAKNALNSGYSFSDAEEHFLKSRSDGEPIAMLMEGMYWQTEAQGTFTSMANSMGEEYSRQKRNLKFMPLPKPTKEIADAAIEQSKTNGGKVHSILDSMLSIGYVKKNISESKRQLAYDFLRFVNTDESLVEFNKIAGMPKALEYTVPDDDYKELSVFGKSIYDIKKQATYIYSISKKDIYVQNQSRFARNVGIWTSSVGGKTQDMPAQVFANGVATAKAYFEGMYTHQKNTWPIK